MAFRTADWGRAIAGRGRGPVADLGKMNGRWHVPMPVTMQLELASATRCHEGSKPESRGTEVSVSSVSAGKL